MTFAGKRRDIGLGSLNVVTLAEARSAAFELRWQIAQGVDPVVERNKITDPVPTFRAAAAVLHE